MFVIWINVSWTVRSDVHVCFPTTEYKESLPRESASKYIDDWNDNSWVIWTLQWRNSQWKGFIVTPSDSQRGSNVAALHSLVWLSGHGLRSREGPWIGPGLSTWSAPPLVGAGWTRAGATWDTSLKRTNTNNPWDTASDTQCPARPRWVSQCLRVTVSFVCDSISRVWAPCVTTHKLWPLQIWLWLILRLHTLISWGQIGRDGIIANIDSNQNKSLTQKALSAKSCRAINTQVAIWRESAKMLTSATP